MRLTRVLPILPVLCAAALAPVPASAQSFFEELFGIGRAARPPVPPRGVPGPGNAAPPPAAPGAPGEPPAPEAPKPVVPRQPVVLRAPAEDNVIGQELMLNGLTGSLKLEKGGSGTTARIVLPGTKVSQPSESCTVPLGGGPLPLTSEGRPEGVGRFELTGGECPLRFDVLDGAVLVTPLAGTPTCTFAATDCSTTPRGLWGPPAAALIPRAAEFESARGAADRAVRENYKLITQRLRGQDVRPVVMEQAAFSSDREQLCRTYAREGAHGFCNLRFSENRALALATRLGITTTTAAPTASAAPRRRKPAPGPAVDGMNPDAGGPPLAE